MKRSECTCICHTDAYLLGNGPIVNHVVPCCEPDDNLIVPEVSIKSAFSAELCAREILNEAIKSMAETVLNMSDKDQRHQSIIQPLFGAVEKLKDKYNKEGKKEKAPG